MKNLEQSRSSQQDQQRMLEALAYAKANTVRTSPNPKVGCVIYDSNGHLLAQGVTSPPGGPHAEVNAINAAKKAGHSLKNAIVYVTLEPCSHTGRTGPCTLALIREQVARVCIGTGDPNPLVAGRGIKALSEANIAVTTQVAEEHCKAHHEPFFKWISTGKPWVSLKGAMTLDGCLATANGHSNWITGIEARTHVHQLRARVDAMMVGGETARRDRPSLTVRHCEGSDPQAIAISKTLSIPNDAPFLRPGTILLHGQEASEERKASLEDLGAKLIELPEHSSGKGLDLNHGLLALGSLGITHLCVEGGGFLHGAFLQDQLVDDVHLYIAPRLIGRGKPLFNFSSVNTIHDGITLEETVTQTLGPDLYLYGKTRYPNT